MATSIGVSGAIWAISIKMVAGRSPFGPTRFRVPSGTPKNRPFASKWQGRCSARRTFWTFIKFFELRELAEGDLLAVQDAAVVELDGPNHGALVAALVQHLDHIEHLDLAALHVLRGSGEVALGRRRRA